MAFIAFAGIVVLAAAPEKVLGRLGGLTALTGGLSHVSEVDPEQSAASRYAIWRVAMTIFRDSPIIGIGWSAYPDAHRVVVRRIEGAPRTAFGARDAHGTYVKLLAESGVVGLVLFLGIVVSSRREIVRVARQIKDTQPEVSRFLRMLLVGQIAYLQCAIFGSYEHLPFFYLYTMMSVVAARLYAKETAAVPLAPLPGPVQTLPQRAFRLRRGGGAVAQLGPG
jgi:O-antigen ligase